MKYFCKEEDRNGTDYHEFQKGKWYKQTFFDSHSILIRDDVFTDIGLKALCEKCIPEYDYYSGSVVTEAVWKKMLKEAKKQGCKSAKVVANLPYYITTPIIFKFISNSCTDL